MHQQQCPVSVLRGHEDGVNCVVYVTSEVLASASADGILKLWDVKLRRTVQSIAAHTHSIQSINIITAAQLATSGRDGILKVWDSNHFVEPVLSLRTGCNHFCNSSSDKSKRHENILVSATTDISKVLVWDTRTPAVPVSIIGWGEGAEESSSHGMVTSLLLDTMDRGTDTTGETCQGGGSVLGVLAGYEDGNLSCFDLRNCSEPVAKIKPHKDPIFALDTSPRNSATVITGAADTSLCRSRLVWGQLGAASGCSPTFEAVDGVNAKSTGTSAVRFRGDGRLVVSCHWDGTVRLFDSKRLKPLAVLRHHRAGANAVDFAKCGSSPDSAIFVTGSKDGTVAIWNVFQNTFRHSEI